MGLLATPVLIAIFTALAEFFRFLATAEGQKLAATWAADHDRLRKDLAAGWQQIEGLFRGQM